MSAAGAGIAAGDVVLGRQDFLSTELYQPLGSSRFFIAPRAFFLKQARGNFVGNHEIAEYHDPAWAPSRIASPRRRSEIRR